MSELSREKVDCSGKEIIFRNSSSANGTSFSRDTMICDLRKSGFNRNVKIPEDIWKKHERNIYRTELSLARFLNQEKKSYRDDRKVLSLHLKDYRNFNNSEKKFVVEVERFNPEYYPLMHLITDFPNWIWHNRID